MTATPTSGAADLRTAAQAVIDRWDTPLWKDVPATAEYIGRLRAALAAGQATAAPAQPAAQQGVAYAALHDEVVRLAQVAIRECQYKGNDMPQDWMESAMRACRLIAASHGQAPAAVPGDFLSHKLAWREAIAQCGLAVSADDPDRSYWEHELRAFDRAYSELASITPQADSVQEDAADPLQGAANWLAEAHGQFSPVVLSGCLMIGYNRAKRLHDAALAARKQGEKHDR